MKIEVLKFHVMNCSTCNRDTLMAEVKIEIARGEPPCSPFMLFCSGCGGYFEIGQAGERAGKQREVKPSRSEGPTGPES